MFAYVTRRVLSAIPIALIAVTACFFILRLAPGGHHPEHYHGFAQVWYLLSGEFKIDGKMYGPGTMIFHPDPHFEGEFHTETGGDILIVQYPGPTTAERPIYDDRFNMKARRAVAEERIDR